MQDYCGCDKCFDGLKCQPKTPEHPKSFCCGCRHAAGEEAPDKVYAKYFEDIVHAGADFHIGFSVKGFECIISGAVVDPVSIG